MKKVVTDPKKAKELRCSNTPQETNISPSSSGIAERSNNRIYLPGHPGDDLINDLDESVIHERSFRIPASVDGYAKLAEAVIATTPYGAPNTR